MGFGGGGPGLFFSLANNAMNTTAMMKSTTTKMINPIITLLIRDFLPRNSTPSLLARYMRPDLSSITARATVLKKYGESRHTESRQCACTKPCRERLSF